MENCISLDFTDAPVAAETEALEAAAAHLARLVAKAKGCGWVAQFYPINGGSVSLAIRPDWIATHSLNDDPHQKSAADVRGLDTVNGYFSADLHVYFDLSVDIHDANGLTVNRKVLGLGSVFSFDELADTPQSFDLPELLVDTLAAVPA